MQSNEEDYTTEDLLQWLIEDMQFKPFLDTQGRPLPYPTVNTMRLLHRGNLVPVWNFFLSRLRSDAEVIQTRENLILSKNEKWQEIQGIVTSSLSVPPFDADKADAHPRKRKPAGRSEVVKAAHMKNVTNTAETSRRKDKTHKEDLCAKREVARKRVNDLRKQVVDCESQLQGRMDQLSHQSFHRNLTRYSSTLVKAGAAALDGYDSMCKKKVQLLNEYSRKLTSFTRNEAMCDLPRSDDAESFGDCALGTQDNHFKPGPTRGAPMGRNVELDQLRELVNEDCRLQAVNLRQSLSASHTSFTTSSQTGSHRQQPLQDTLKIEAGSNHSRNLNARFGTHPGLSQRRNIDLLVTTQRHPPENGKDFTFASAEVTSGTLVGWPSPEPPAKLQDRAGWLGMALQNPVNALRALAMKTAALAEEVQTDIASIDVQKDAQLQRDAFEKDRRQDQDHRGEGVGPAGLRAVWVKDRGARLGDSGTDELLRERQRAHVEQLKATEVSITKAISAQNVCKEVVQNLRGYWISVGTGGGPPHAVPEHTFKNLELAVWELERKVAGQEAYNGTLTKEVADLQRQCQGRREARARLQTKWQTVKDFDARKKELQELGDYLRSLIQAASNSWENHMEAAKAFSGEVLVPSCSALQMELHGSRGLLESERKLHSELVQRRLPPIPLPLMEAGENTGEADADAWRTQSGHEDKAASRKDAEDSLRAMLKEQMHSQTGLGRGLSSSAELIRSQALERVPLPLAAKSYQKAAELVEDRLWLQARAGMWESQLAQWVEEMEEPDRRVSLCRGLHAEQKRVEEVEWEPKLSEALSKAANLNDERISDVKQEFQIYVERPAGVAADWITVNDSEGRPFTLAQWMRVVRGHTAKIFENAD